MMLTRLTRLRDLAGKCRNYYSYCREPFHPLPTVPITQSAEEAVKIVKSGLEISDSNGLSHPRIRRSRG